MKKFVFAVPVLALALGGTTACATKKLVRTDVGEVNGKVDTLSKSVEETQERTRANEGRDRRGRSEGAAPPVSARMRPARAPPKRAPRPTP